MKWISGHRVWSTIIAIAVILGGYYEYKKITATPTATKYVLARAAKGTLITSISGTGQVSASNQIDIKPKASGDVIWINAKAGDAVRTGQALAQIDDTDAKQAIADAEQTLTQAKLQFQKDSAQAPIDYQKSLETLNDAKTDLAITYTDTYNTLSSAYIDLPEIATGMQNIIYGTDFSQQWNIDIFRNSTGGSGPIVEFANIAEKDYKIARAKYDQTVLDYKTLTRYSNNDDLEKSLTSFVDTMTATTQALQGILNLLDAVADDALAHNHPLPAVTTMRTNTRNYLSTSNGNLSALLNQQKSLDAAKKTIRDSEHNIEIYQIGNPTGNTPISLQSSGYSIADQERKLKQLKDDLSNYVIIAPFAGTLSTFIVKQFDTVSTGSSVATLITKQNIASITLNEVDIAKVKIGQKTTLTFDAVPGLSITGGVSEINTVGTVSQGVVSYSVKIIFDTQDERVKSGMSVSAAVITDVKSDVLLVPNSAVKYQGNTNYVQVLVGGVPQDKTVEIGLSNDSQTEITNGLNEGDEIITQTISSTAQTTPSAGGLRIPGIGGGGGFRSGN